MAAPTKVELAVEMTCDGCVHAVQKSLKNIEGVKNVEISLQKGQVVVESCLPSSELIRIVETTGKRAVLVGSGTSLGQKNLGAAVAMIEAGNRLVKGVIRLVQSDERCCVIEGTIDGLSPGQHSICVHELGDLTNPCVSCGDVFPGVKGKQGSQQAGFGILHKFLQLISSPVDQKTESFGEITTINAEANGRAVFRVEKADFSIWDVIGRSVVIHQGNLLKTNHPGMSGDRRLACGIIARSAGLFENTKKICACDGVTLWDERDVPIAGEKRQAKAS